MSEHKPCPFCGHNNLRACFSWISPPTEYEARIQCDECDSQGPTAYFYETEAEAEIEAWKLWDQRT